MSLLKCTRCNTIYVLCIQSAEQFFVNISGVYWSVTMAIHWLTKQEWIWNKTRPRRKQLKYQLCIYSHHILSLPFISWKCSLRWNNLSFTKSCLLMIKIFLNSPFGNDKVVIGITAKWKFSASLKLKTPSGPIKRTAQVYFHAVLLWIWGYHTVVYSVTTE